MRLKDFVKLCKEYGATDETEIGIVGHFGEFLKLDKYGVSVSEVSRTAKFGWGDMTDIKPIKVIDIHLPDKGPDPD